MVQLEKEMAVIGTVTEMLRKYDNKSEEVRVDIKMIYNYSLLLELRSGYTVVNGFTESALEDFLKRNDEIFCYLKPSASYRLRVDRLLPESERTKPSLESANRLVRSLIELWDPSVNYPLDVLNSMRLPEVSEALPW